MTVRWSQDDYDRYVRRGQPAPLTERAWQGTIARLARQHGYVYYHTFDARRSPSGFVDCVLAKAGSPLLCVELKTDVGQVTLAQQAWLDALAGCTGVVAEIWRPKDLETILTRLRA